MKLYSGIAMSAVLLATAAQAAPIVGYAPKYDLTAGKAGGAVPNKDYWELFPAGTANPWGAAAASVSELVISGTAVLDAAANHPVALVRMGAFLAAHHIGLTVTIEAVRQGYNGASATCGVNAPGHGDMSGARKIAESLRGAGVSVASVALDEPLSFGHFDPAGCRYSISDLAADVAQVTQAFLAVYPAAHVVDIEAVCALGTKTRPADCPVPAAVDVEQWVSAIRASLPLTRFDFDVQWALAWAPASQALVVQLGSLGVPYGLDWDALARQNPTPTVAWTASGWLARAAANYAAWTANVVVPTEIEPAALVFASWGNLPPTVLPANGNTLMGAINDYCATNICQQGSPEPAPNAP